MTDIDCELCHVALNKACKDCHFYRHYESFYTIQNRDEYRVNVRVFQLTPKGKFHIRVDGHNSPGVAACGRSEHG